MRITSQLLLTSLYCPGDCLLICVLCIIIFDAYHQLRYFLRYRRVYHYMGANVTLTHWGRVTHICVGKLTIIGSDNDLSPDRRQAIIWTNAGLLLIGPPGTNISEILIEILIFSFKKMRLKVSSAKRRPFCLGLNVLRAWEGAKHVLHSVLTMSTSLLYSQMYSSPLPLQISPC